MQLATRVTLASFRTRPASAATADLTTALLPCPVCFTTSAARASVLTSPVTACVLALARTHCVLKHLTESRSCPWGQLEVASLRW